MGKRIRTILLYLFLTGILCLAGCGRGQSDKEPTLPVGPASTVPVTLTPPTAPTEAETASVTFPLVPDESWQAAQAAALERAAQIMEQMSDEELICQMLVVAPETVSPEVTVLTGAGLELNKFPVGGLLLHTENGESAEQLLALCQAMQEASDIPLLLMAQEEGGRSVTFMKSLEQTVIRNMFSYRGDGRARAFENAKTLASNLLSLGLNTDLAPVADVWSDMNNKYIGERAYSDDFEKAAVLIEEAVQGFRAAGAISCLKYFPGGGEGLVENKKDPFALLQKTEAQLLNNELIPFAAGIQAGADMVMIGSFSLPAIDPVNLAPFSPFVVSGLLREKVGFQGVVITDELENLLTSQILTASGACLKAIAAGCDLLLCPVSSEEDLEECIQVLLAAMEAGTLTRERLTESVGRILALKIRQGLMK